MNKYNKPINIYIATFQEGLLYYDTCVITINKKHAGRAKIFMDWYFDRDVFSISPR